MSRVRLAPPWLIFDLGQPMQVLSWAINRPGFSHGRRIVWRKVRDGDLPKDMDVGTWFGRELERCHLADAVGFLTSRDITRFVEKTATVGGICADVVATVGLSNAERIGTRRRERPARATGTINIAVRLNHGLSKTGLIEAMSIATQARTAAVIEVGLMLATGLATGTGTDCIAIAAPDGVTDFAGLHTDIGEAVGRAVYEAVKAGAQDWMRAPGQPHERT